MLSMSFGGDGKVEESFNAAIIGAGSISRFHTRGYQRCEKIGVIAVSDISEEQMAKYKAEFPEVERTYKDYNEMLKGEARHCERLHMGYFSL